MVGITAEGGWPRYPDFDPGSLVGIMEGVSSYVRYVALAPDTPRQQVWSIEWFEAHLEELSGCA